MIRTALRYSNSSRFTLSALQPIHGGDRGASLGGVNELPQAGGCQCGKIRYEITEELQSSQCLDCQHLTSSVFLVGLRRAPTTVWMICVALPACPFRGRGRISRWRCATPAARQKATLFQWLAVPPWFPTGKGVPTDSGHSVRVLLDPAARHELGARWVNS
jgi:hypothetical protein